MKTLLINREFNVPGNWYAPQNKLNEYNSVLDVELTQTCSSAGDWDGVIFQLLNGIVYVIPFSQENNWPRGDGFTVYTSDVFASIPYKNWDSEQREAILHDYCEFTYAM